MSTLMIGNLKWETSRHEGKTAFVFGKTHAVLFQPSSLPANKGFYLVVEQGKPVHVNESVSECLEASTGIVLDYLARQFVPSWE